jgi:hypothetical protein
MSLRARHMALLALAALALRGPWLLSPGSPQQMDSLCRLARLDGADLYTSVESAGRYGGLPLGWLILRGLGWLQSLVGGSLVVWVRLPAVAGDLALSLALYLVVERRSRSSAALAASGDAWRSARAGLLAGLGWALNPLAALLSVGHGSADSLALALLLLAAWWLEYGDDPRSELWAALSLAAAVALSTWPLACLPLYLGAFTSRQERLRFTAWMLLPLVLMALPWCVQDGGAAMAERMVTGPASELGLGAALRAAFFAADAPLELYRQADDLWRMAGLGLLVAAGSVGLWQCRRLRLTEGLPWAALLLLALLPALPLSALAWPMGLALAVSPRLSWRLGLTGLSLLLGHDALFDPQALAGAAAWEPVGLQAGWLLLWAFVNLAWWLSLMVQWARLAPQVWLPQRRRPY